MWTHGTKRDFLVCRGLDLQVLEVGRGQPGAQVGQGSMGVCQGTLSRVLVDTVFRKNLMSA